MRIVIATPVFYPMINGVAMFSYNLAVGLAKRGHEVMVITPSQNKAYHVENLNGAMVVYLKSEDVKVYPDQIHKVPEKKQIFYKHGLKAAVFPYGQVKRALDTFRPDVVHVQGGDPVGAAVVKYAKKQGLPIVATEHNQPEVLTESLHIPRVLKKPINNALSAYLRGRQKKCDYMTMPTQLAIDHLIGDRGSSVPIEAVSNGVDLTAFKPGKANNDIGSVYTLYNIPRGVPILLYVGRVDPEKNVGAVIEAFANFLYNHKLDNLSKTLLVIAGDGVDKNRLERLAADLGVNNSIRFLGRVMPPALYEVYRMADAFATASEIETQGIVLIEAAASGLPLITVNGGAVAEICKDGENGYLLTSGNKAGMANAMAEILSNSEKRALMGQKSVQIAKRHDLSHTIDKFIEIYEKVIKRK